jgi:hypothetical protein
VRRRYEKCRCTLSGLCFRMNSADIPACCTQVRLTAHSTALPFPQLHVVTGSRCAGRLSLSAGCILQSLQDRARCMEQKETRICSA